ncbi:MAG: Crp/Fnr family transcriptional regulator [Chloroflexi bacterium]|nr:Crp/Fnr family transcriptional regulator [Chloroflexota bacterium]
MAVSIGSLKSIPYFSALKPDELEVVGALVFEKTAGRGEMVLLEGEPAEVMYFLVSGVAKVFKTSVEGKEQTLNILRPGDSFNDVSVFDDGVNLASVQAMTPIDLYGLRKADINSILKQYPQIALNIIRGLAGRVRQLTALVEDLSFRHVTSRVAKILLEYTADESTSRPRLTQQEMASMAGTAREVVARSLKALEDEGLISFDRHKIVINNKEELARMAEISI